MSAYSEILEEVQERANAATSELVSKIFQIDAHAMGVISKFEPSLLRQARLKMRKAQRSYSHRCQSGKLNRWERSTERREMERLEDEYDKLLAETKGTEFIPRRNKPQVGKQCDKLSQYIRLCGLDGSYSHQLNEPSLLIDGHFRI